jgi:hypothetical protein
MAAEIEIGQILQDFTVIMIVAGAIAMISYRFKQPMVIVLLNLNHMRTQTKLQ